MSAQNEIQKLSPTPPPLEKIKRNKMGRFINFMVFLYFFSLFISIQFFQFIDLNLYHFFRLNLLFIGISFFIPISLYRKKLNMSFYEYTLINILSIGPFLCTLCLILNFLFSGEVYTETYAIVNKEREQDHIVLTLENEQYKAKDYLRTIYDHEDIGSIGSAQKLQIQFSDGLFGIRIIEKKGLY